MRIAIVNDMLTATEALRRIIATAPEHQIAWTATDGAEAVRMCAADRPDLVLMDLIMPGMDGVEATRRIMAATPCPILIVTSSVEDQAARTFAAMGHGALDAIDTPALGSANPLLAARPLLAKIRALHGLTADTRPGGGPQSAPHRRQDGPLVAIGASAGGPAALAVILEKLPRDFPAAIAIVQHIDERFASGMAGWLTQHGAIPIDIATEDAVPRPGTALLAAPSDHLVAKGGGRLGYRQQPAAAIYRPSIDVFFDSLCAHWSGEVVGVLLTGMGSDGARGLKALRDAGHHTIAQDRATSAVYGMPKAAAAMSAAVEILPLEGIAAALVGMFAAGRRKGGENRWTY